MSKTHEIAWAAGFFDGEGYVTVQKRNQKAKNTGKLYVGHYLRIGINHVSPEPLLEVQRLFGGNIRKQNPEKVTGNRKQRHSWSLSTQLAEYALKQMLPFFKNKKEVALLGLELQDTMGDTGQRVDSDTLIYRELLKQKIQEVNAKD